MAKPYLQLGNAPRPLPLDSRVLMWKMAAADPALAVEVRPAGGAWAKVPVRWKAVHTPPVPAYQIGSAMLAGLNPDSGYEYRLVQGMKPLFASAFRTRRRPGSPFTFAVIGDCGSGRPGQKALAVELARQKPDLVLIPGDIVYDAGREREYRPNFFDVYNADRPDPKVGAPLLRNTLFAATVGNHDVRGRDFGKGPDGLAYYYNWSQPLNGPAFGLGSAYLPHLQNGSGAEREAFLRAAAPNYPRMGSFSFEDGDAHFTLLDSNPYVDWEDSQLQRWLRDDLTRTNAKWKVVLFHHPPFNASLTHGGDQQMRVLSPLFEAAKVDLVIAGHEHNYQRTKPLRFLPNRDPKTGKIQRSGSRISGKLTTDERFDGKARTRPDGPLYLVSGAGGQKLYKIVLKSPAYYAAHHRRDFTFTLVGVTPKRLTVRQVDAKGREVDRFVVDQ